MRCYYIVGASYARELADEVLFIGNFGFSDEGFEC